MGVVSTNTQIHHHSARLTPSYRTTAYKTFCLEKDITILMEVLQNFGLDIFANHNFDTWVLFEIHARVINNSWSDPLATCVSPLFSLISKLATQKKGQKEKKNPPANLFSLFSRSLLRAQSQLEHGRRPLDAPRGRKYTRGQRRTSLCRV